MYNPDSTTFAQRLVLCCLVLLTEEGNTPADAAEIRSTAKRLLEGANHAPVGDLSEADVARALNTLADRGLLDERRPGDRSPVGKGRPRYELDADSTRIRDSLESDEDVGKILSGS